MTNSNFLHQRGGPLRGEALQRYEDVLRGEAPRKIIKRKIVECMSFEKFLKLMGGSEESMKNTFHEGVEKIIKWGTPCSDKEEVVDVFMKALVNPAVSNGETQRHKTSMPLEEEDFDRDVEFNLMQVPLVFRQEALHRLLTEILIGMMLHPATDEVVTAASGEDMKLLKGFYSLYERMPTMKDDLRIMTDKNRVTVTIEEGEKGVCILGGPYQQKTIAYVQINLTNNKQR